MMIMMVPEGVIRGDYLENPLDFQNTPKERSFFIYLLIFNRKRDSLCFH